VLLQEGFKPRRTLLIAIGHDEEVGGAQGAGHIAALLAAQGTKLAMVWDEGRYRNVGQNGAAALQLAMGCFDSG
jgi:carboxypeptidase PM20D1